jgi:hypothetical protein
LIFISISPFVMALVRNQTAPHSRGHVGRNV